MMRERRNGACPWRAAPQKKMKRIKRAISFLTVICCLAAGAGPLYAAASNEPSGTEIPQIVFTNEPKGEPDLYVKKTVESAVQGQEVPEAAKEKEFTFTLKLGGGLVRGERYYKWEKDGDAYKWIEHRTDESGRFFLKHGEEAWFKSEDIRALTPTAQYEVTEDPVDGYQQTEPTLNGPAEGPVTKDGANVEFVNQYTPQGIGNKAALEVQKSISYPKDYELPGEDQEFTFSLSVNNAPWAGQPYKIQPIVEGSGDEQDAVTNGEGEFKLKGGYKAVFTDPLQAGMDYVVKEVDLPEGWRATGEISKEGSTTKGTNILYFDNSPASFTVTKELEKDSAEPEDGNIPEFTFELTDAGGKEWADAAYYLYVYDTESRTMIISQNKAEDTEGTEGEDQTEGAGKTPPYKTTDKNGRFTLQPDQAAVFFNIPTGTVYNVREIAPGAAEGTGGILYEQTYPENPKNYQNESVAAGNKVLLFKNKGRKTVNALNVTKEVVNEKGEAPSTQDTEFYFILEKKDQGAWTPMNGAKCTVLPGGDSRAADQEGRFHIKANETAQFKALEQDEIYRVREDETLLPEEYISRTGVQEGTLSGNALNFLFKNGYDPAKLDLELTKVNDENAKLPGAGFMLYWDQACTKPVFPADSGADDQDKMIYETDEKGLLTFSNLKAGTYYLKEVKAPSGYVVLDKIIEIKIRRTADGLSMTVDGKHVLSANGTKEIADDPVVKGIAVSTSANSAGTQNQKKDIIKITVCNSELYGLPSTGGPGIFWYTIGGMLMMMAAAILYRYQYAGGGVRKK